MVKGLDLFRERFRPFQGAMTLIGGAACDEWFTSKGLNFRATNDLDLVIMMDDVAPDFISAMRDFIAETCLNLTNYAAKFILRKFWSAPVNVLPPMLDSDNAKQKTYKTRDLPTRNFRSASR